MAIEYKVDSKLQDYGKGQLLFAKLHVRWMTLLQIAEALRFQKPMVSKSCLFGLKFHDNLLL